jgi:hypothetical protein
MESSIARIRASCSIAWAWRILGLPGTPAKDCKSPFRSENRASFSIYQAKDGERFFDHGDASGGDVVDFWAKAKGCSVKEALRQLLAMTGSEAPNRPPEHVSAPEGIRWPPDIRTPLGDECYALATLRSLSHEAFFLAGRLGTLKVATVYGQKSWVITDQSAACAEARRFDGQSFIASGKKLKSFALPGSKKDRPVGIASSNPALDAIKNILLVEGQPDYFAAMQLALMSEISFRPAAMLGAATSLGPQAKKYLRGVRVVIIPHNDRSGEGEKAALKWAGQIQALGATDCFIQRLPIVCNDLNDFLIQRPGNGHQLLKGFNDGSTPGHSPV